LTHRIWAAPAELRASTGQPGGIDLMTVTERLSVVPTRRNASNRGRRRRLQWRGLALPALLLVAWELLCALNLFTPDVMPSPVAVASELARLWSKGQLLGDILITTQRVALGFLLGTVTATVFGAVVGYSRIAGEYLDPTLQALKAVPSLAWVPLFILWFGIFEVSKIALIAAGVFFPVYLNLVTGIRSTDRKLVEVGRINGLGRFDLVTRILVPAALPSYVTGLRAGLALGWMFVIAAELMGASKGLGFLMLDGQMTGRPATIVAALILFAIAGKVSDALLVAAGRRVLSWQDDFASTQVNTGQ
jgi:sulfonate transport system permease protein